MPYAKFQKAASHVLTVLHLLPDVLEILFSIYYYFESPNVNLHRCITCNLKRFKNQNERDVDASFCTFTMMVVFLTTS